MVRWIQQAHDPGKKGALHRQLGYPVGQPLPPGLLNELYNANIGTHVRGLTVTPLLKRRVVFAVNAQKR